MSVLIEALTLVTRKALLDLRYPGGTDAYLRDLARLSPPPRYICDDDTVLVNISFYNLEHMERAMTLLDAYDFKGVRYDRFIDFAVLDQDTGSMLTCDWLEWSRHPDGFAYAWVSGTEPGPVAAPVSWTPGTSHEPKRLPDDGTLGRHLRLADQGGVETWLDFKTGEISMDINPRAIGR